METIKMNEIEAINAVEQAQNVIHRLKTRMEQIVDQAEMELFRMKMEIKKKQDVELEAQAKLEEVRK